MRIRFSVELRVERRQPEADGEPQFEHRDTDTLVEQIGQPPYVGFAPVMPDQRTN
jgi:hypothetical protein